MRDGDSSVHQPPPEAIVAQLVAAGVSAETALAMERWKAVEVLDLLQVPEPLMVQREAEMGMPVIGTIGW